MEEKFDFEAALKVVQSGQLTTTLQPRQTAQLAWRDICHRLCSQNERPDMMIFQPQSWYTSWGKVSVYPIPRTC